MERKDSYTCHMPSIGPMLEEVLAAQDAAFRSTEFPIVESYADRLVALARDLGSPVVWPVGLAAERLVGASIIVGKGQLRARDWNRYLSGEPVLLVCIAATSPLPLLAAATEARSRGAGRLVACGISIGGMKLGVPGSLDEYFSLDSEGQQTLDEALIAV